jgi:hypothetical protein
LSVWWRDSPQRQRKRTAQFGSPSTMEDITFSIIPTGGTIFTTAYPRDFTGMAPGNLGSFSRRRTSTIGITSVTAMTITSVILMDIGADSTAGGTVAAGDRGESATQIQLSLFDMKDHSRSARLLAAMDFINRSRRTAIEPIFDLVAKVLGTTARQKQ